MSRPIEGMLTNTCRHACEEYPYCDAPVPQYADNTEYTPYRHGNERCTKELCDAYEDNLSNTKPKER